MEKLNKAGALLSHGFKSICGKVTGKSHNGLNIEMYHSILGLCSNKNAVETSDSIVKNPEINHSISRDEIIERLERIENLLKQKSEIQTDVQVEENQVFLRKRCGYMAVLSSVLKS